MRGTDRKVFVTTLYLASLRQIAKDLYLLMAEEVLEVYESMYDVKFMRVESWSREEVTKFLMDGNMSTVEELEEISAKNVFFLTLSWLTNIIFFYFI